MMTAADRRCWSSTCAWGDPETQPLMHRMESDFVPALMAAASGELAGVKLEWRSGPSVCVVLASGGYPGAYETGHSDPRRGSGGSNRRDGIHAGNAYGRGRPLRLLAAACSV